MPNTCQHCGAQLADGQVCQCPATLAQQQPPQSFPPQGFTPPAQPTQSQGYAPQQYPPQGYPQQYANPQQPYVNPQQGYPPQQYQGYPQQYPGQPMPPKQESQVSAMAKEAFSESRNAVMGLIKDPSALMQEKQLPAVACFALLLLQAFCSILLFYTVIVGPINKINALSARIGIAAPSISTLNLIFYPVLWVALSSAIVFGLIFIFGKIFSTDISSSSLFSTVSIASVPFSAALLLSTIAAVFFVNLDIATISSMSSTAAEKWFGDLQFYLGFTLLMLLLAYTYAAFLLELGVRRSITANTKRTLALTVASAITMFMTPWIIIKTFMNMLSKTFGIAFENIFDMVGRYL